MVDRDIPGYVIEHIICKSSGEAARGGNGDGSR